MNYFSRADCVNFRIIFTAMWVFQNNKTAAMLVSQTSPVGVELLSYTNAPFCSNIFA